MKAKGQFAVVLVTAPDLKVARKLARIILESRLAACANLLPKIESHYWWQGKLQTSAEILMILKTTQARLKELEKCVVKNHPYDTPEFIVLPIVSGQQRYFKWIKDSVRACFKKPATRSRRREEANALGKGRAKIRLLTPAAAIFKQPLKKISQ